MTHDAFAAPRYNAHVATWAERLLVALRELYKGRSGNIMDADDAAMDFVMKFLEAPEQYMARSSSPEELARMVAYNNMRGHHRRQRVQRGEGARAVPDGQGGYRLRRQVMNYGDATDVARLGPVGRVGAAGPADSPEFDAVMREDDRRRIAEAMAMLSPADRSLLAAVYVEGQDRESVRAGLGCGPAAFRQREKRARDRFAECFRALAHHYEMIG